MKLQTTQINGQTFHLHPLCGAYWEEQRILLIADLHLGKVTHFRTRGLPAPLGVTDANWDKLMSLVLDFEPARVIFLGDLFHSHYNEEWEGLCELMQGFQHIQFELVKGNHDILAEELYLSSGLILHEEPLLLDGFALSHHPLDSWSDTHYNLAGHVHPGVWLQGRGHQRLRLPCFFFGAHQGLLPAFGQFTGLGIVQTGQGDRVFVIAEDSVQEVA